jgi:PST family polysaccharide transporter
VLPALVNLVGTGATKNEWPVTTKLRHAGTTITAAQRHLLQRPASRNHQLMVCDNDIYVMKTALDKDVHVHQHAPNADGKVFMFSTRNKGPVRGAMVRNMVFLGLGQVATTAITIVLNAAIARTLGAADFGLLFLLTSVATFAYVFVDWGHPLYIPREVALRPERAGDLLGSALALRAATALIMCIVTMPIIWFIGYELRTRELAAITIIAFLPTYLALSYGWVFRGRERMDCEATIGVVNKFSGLVLSLICLALGERVLALILILIVSGSITFAVARALYRRLGLPPLTVTLTTARELLRGGAPMLAFFLVIAVQPYIDANMLHKLAPPGVLGWYAAAWNMAGTLIAPAGILGAAMYPLLSKTAAEKDKFAQTVRTGFRPMLLIALLGAIGTFFFADIAVDVIYSKQKFAPAGAILQAFAPALFLLYIDMMFSQAIIAMGRAGSLAWVKLASVVVHTALAFVLIPWSQARYENGGVGLMFALAGGELLMVVAGAIFIWRAIKAEMFFDLLRGFGVAAVTIAIKWSLPVLPWFVDIPLCISLFFVLCLFVGLLNRDDVKLLFGAFSKRGPATPVAAASD